MPRLSKIKENSCLPTVATRYRSPRLLCESPERFRYLQAVLRVRHACLLNSTNKFFYVFFFYLNYVYSYFMISEYKLFVQHKSYSVFQALLCSFFYISPSTILTIFKSKSSINFACRYKLKLQ